MTDHEVIYMADYSQKSDVRNYNPEENQYLFIHTISSNSK